MKKTAAVAVVDCSSLMVTGREIPKLAQMAAISSMSDIHFVPFGFCSSGAGGALPQRLLQKGFRLSGEMQEIETRFQDLRCWFMRLSAEWWI
ncbi:MAG: hypothetical protein R3E39_14170 [Anaerolineae bacterium]